jgi:hypothetical protein
VPENEMRTTIMRKTCLLKAGNTRSVQSWLPLEQVPPNKAEQKNP